MSEIPIRIPPLTERHGDILLLARTFFEHFNGSNNRKLSGFSRDAIEVMENYGWPGNVRELKNKVKRAVIMAEGKLITPGDLELEGEHDNSEKNNFKLKEVREQAEKDVILRALAHVNGKISQAATLMGVSRPTLYSLIEKLKIKI